MGSRLGIPRARARALVVSALAAISLVACSVTTPLPLAGRISICAQDPIRGDCVTGDFQPLGAAQTLHLAVTDSGGKPLAHAGVVVKVAGANARTSTLTTGSDGTVAFAYAGTHQGTDTVTAALANGSSTLAPGPAVIHWLPPLGKRHPIVFVHGINEDASVYRHAINQDDSADLTQHKEGTELFEALDLVYDRSFFEAFCYVDDRAYGANPSGCPDPETPTCLNGGDASACVSQSSVDADAVALARAVSALSARAGGGHVTLIAYSMGGAVVRTLLAGCRNSPDPNDVAACAAAVPLLDNVFFLNAAQQGSWLLTVKAGWDAASLAGEEIPSGPASPFTSVVPLLEQSALAAVQNALGLDLNNAAERDLTPRSANILAHNSVAPPAGIDYYTFYGDIQLQLAVNLFGYQLGGTETLPLGDLVMLAQDDTAQATPLWGGGALCDGCPTPIAPFRQVGPYHAWALVDRHNLNFSSLTPLLGDPTAVSGFNTVLQSPAMHLNVTQPGALAPGAPLQVKDITGTVGSPTTDLPDEILSILMQKDGLV